MSAAELQRLTACITCHAWNGDKTRVALCPNNNTVQIYVKSGNTYTLEHTLAEHDQVVTGIDWAPKTNRIVTSSQDRNAYVWTIDTQANVWRPNLVILRINRAATHVRWSPDENKFAVASGAKCVSVCYYEDPNQWWVSKHIKKHKSTVLKVDWHPNNIFLATGSTDFKARVFSAYIKGVDQRPPSGPFGSKLPFGELLLELDSTSGWVHAIKWSPSGNVIAFAGHDSSVNFANIQVQPPAVQRIRLPYLPLRDLLFLSEHSLVGAGDDANPLLFSSNDNGDWTFGSELDTKDHNAAASTSSSALTAFKSKITHGLESAVDTKVETLHQNTITSIQPLGANPGQVGDFSTTGLDGAIIIWHVKTLESKLKGLKIL